MLIHPKEVNSDSQTTLICKLPKLSTMYKKIIMWLSAIGGCFFLIAAHAQNKSKTELPPKPTADTAKPKKPSGITDKVKSSKKKAFIIVNE